MASKKYIRNVIKSFSHVVPDALEDNLPGIKGTISFFKSSGDEEASVKDVFKEIIGDYKKDVDSVKRIFKGFKKGVKTGKFYDREEEASLEGLFGDEGDSLESAANNDSDFSGFDDDFDDSKSVSGGSTDAEFVSDPDAESESILAGAMASGAARTVTSIEKGTAVNFAALNSIDSRLKNLEEASTKYYTNSLDLLSSIKSNMESMVKITGITDTDLPASTIESLFGDGDREFNIQLYKKHLKKKMDGGGYAEMLSMMLGMSTASGLVKEGVRAGLSKIPFMSTVEKISRMMEGYGQLLLHNMANAKGKGPLSSLMRLFGYKTSASSAIDLGSVKQGPTPFDGKTRESIIHVIPNYLSKILNVLSHGEDATADTELIYDMKRRQFASRESITKQYESQKYKSYDIENVINVMLSVIDLPENKKNEIRTAIIKETVDWVSEGKDLYDPSFIKKLKSSYGDVGKLYSKFVGSMSETKRYEVSKMYLDKVAEIQTSETTGYKHSLHGDIIDYDDDQESGLIFDANDFTSLENALAEEITDPKVSSDAIKNLRKEIKENNKRKFKKSPQQLLENALIKSFSKKEVKRYVERFEERDKGRSTEDVGLLDVPKVRLGLGKVNYTLDEMDEIGDAGTDGKLLNKIAGLAIDPGAYAEKGDESLNKAWSWVKGQASSAVKSFKGRKLYEGGYTGFGGKYEPAGVVHGGEYVVNKELVEDPKGNALVQRLEKMRTKGLPGYASGGKVRSNKENDTSRLYDTTGLDLIDESDRKNIISRREKIFKDLQKANVPFNESMTLSLMAEEKPEEIKGLIKKAKREARMRKAGAEGTGYLFFNLKDLVKQEVINPVKEIMTGNKDPKDIANAIREAVPGMAKYGAIGTAAGFFLPGGPLLGALAGGAIGATKQSKAIREYFFGPDDLKKNGGLIPKFSGVLVRSIFGKKAGDSFESGTQKFLHDPLKSVVDGFKDPASRKTILSAGAGAGLMGALFGPGGVLIGALAGGAIGRRKQQGFFNKVMFGKRIVDKDGNIKGYTGGFYQSVKGAFTAMVAGPAQAMLVGGSISDMLPKKDANGEWIAPDPAKINKNFKKGMARLGIGAAAGGLLGSFFGPGGTLIGTLLGGATGIRPVQAMGRRLLFGKKDPDGKKFLTGGLFGSMVSLGKKAMGVIPLIANGVAGIDNPFVRNALKALGLPFSIIPKALAFPFKVVGKSLGFFRRFYAGKHNILKGPELIQAVANDPEIKSGERALLTAQGVISSNLGDIYGLLKEKFGVGTSDSETSSEESNDSKGSKVAKKSNKTKAVNKFTKMARGKFSRILRNADAPLDALTPVSGEENLSNSEKLQMANVRAGMVEAEAGNNQQGVLGDILGVAGAIGSFFLGPGTLPGFSSVGKRILGMAGNSATKMTSSPFALKIVKPIGDKIGSILAPIGEKIGSIVGSVKEGASNLVKGAKDWAVDGIKGVYSKLGESKVGKIFTSAKDSIFNKLKSLGPNGLVKKVANAIKGKAKPIFKFISKHIKGAGPLAIFSGILEGVVGYGFTDGDKKTRLVAAFKGALHGIVTGILFVLSSAAFGIGAWIYVALDILASMASGKDLAGWLLTPLEKLGFIDWLCESLADFFVGDTKEASRKDSTSPSSTNALQKPPQSIPSISSVALFDKPKYGTEKDVYRPHSISNTGFTGHLGDMNTLTTALETGEFFSGNDIVGYGGEGSPTTSKAFSSSDLSNTQYVYDRGKGLVYKYNGGKLERAFSAFTSGGPYRRGEADGILPETARNGITPVGNYILDGRGPNGKGKPEYGAPKATNMWAVDGPAVKKRGLFRIHYGKHEASDSINGLPKTTSQWSDGCVVGGPDLVNDVAKTVKSGIAKMQVIDSVGESAFIPNRDPLEFKESEGRRTSKAEAIATGRLKPSSNKNSSVNGFASASQDSSKPQEAGSSGNGDTSLNALTGILSQILVAIQTLNIGGNPDRQIMDNLFVPYSEALGNPSAVSMNLVGRKLQVGI